MRNRSLWSVCRKLVEATIKISNNAMHWDKPLRLEQHSNQIQHVSLKDGKKLFIDIRRNHAAFPLHSHSFDEICIICRGHVIHELDGVPALLGAGDIAYIPAGVSHEFKDPVSLDLVNVSFKYSSWIESDNALFRLVSELKEVSKNKPMYSISWSALREIKTLLEKAITFNNLYADEMPYYEEYNQALLSQLFLNLLMDGYITENQADQNGLCLELVQAFRRHEAPVAIKNYVCERQFNYATFISYFRKLFGTTPKKIYQKELLYAARRYMMVNQLENIDQLDEFMVINDMDAFIKSYRKEFDD